LAFAPSTAGRVVSLVKSPGDTLEILGTCCLVMDAFRYQRPSSCQQPCLAGAANDLRVWWV